MEEQMKSVEFFSKADTHYGGILLVEIGNVVSEILARLQGMIESVFNCRCLAGISLRVPEYAYVRRRRQYSAGAILKRLPGRRDGSILGVVDLDLCVPELNFVIGLADPAGKRAIIALPRLQESYYGNRENPSLLLERAAKEAMHELGYTSGLRHCMDRGCVMRFSNSILDTDQKGQRFCARCTRKLQV